MLPPAGNRMSKAGAGPFVPVRALGAGEQGGTIPCSPFVLVITQTFR